MINGRWKDLCDANLIEVYESNSSQLFCPRDYLYSLVAFASHTELAGILIEWY